MVAAKRANGAAAVSGSAKGQQPPVQTKSEKPVRRAQLHHQLQKTKLCSYHLKGACHYGQDCAFAHTCTELQVTPDLRKTRLCKAFMEGTCTNEECTFAHGEVELVSTDLYHKRSLCKWNEKGKCRNGDKCRFAHGLTELRGEGSAAAASEQQPASLPSTIAALGKPASAKQAASSAGAPSGPEPMKVRTAMNLVDPVGPLGGASAGLGGASALASMGLSSQLPLAAPAPWQLAHHPLAQGIYEEVALQSEIAKLKENISTIAHQWNSIQSRMATSDDPMGALGTSPAALAAMAAFLEEAHVQQAYTAPMVDDRAIAGPPGFGHKPYAQEADVDVFDAMSAMNMSWMYGEHAAIGA